MHKKYSEQQQNQAHNADLVEILKRNGEQIKPQGKEYLWASGEPTVTIKGNLWYNHYEQIGGDTIGFVMKYFGKSYIEALDYILDNQVGKIYVSNHDDKAEKKLALPTINKNNVAGKKYLQVNRRINPEIVEAFIKRNLIYQSNHRVDHKTFNNVVFVGYDKNNKIRHAHERSANIFSKFRITAEGSKPEFSFHWNGTDNSIYLFEAPIDMLSFISMNESDWEKHYYAAACGLSDRVLFQCIKDNPNISKVYLCLDNDEKGLKTAYKIAEKLKIKHIDYEILVPFLKDWNEDLIYGLGENQSWKELEL